MTDEGAPKVEQLMEFMYQAAIGLVQTDANGNVLLINPMAVQLLMPLARRHDLLENLFTTFDMYAPELRQLVSGFSRRVGTIVHNHRIVISSGSRGQSSPVFFSLSLVKLDDQSLMAMFQDISESVKSERLLQRQEAWINAMLAATVDYALMVIGEDGTILQSNASVEKVTGYDQTQLSGRPYSIFFVPGAITPDRVSDRLREADQAGLSLDEGWMLRTDGRQFWGHTAITPLEPSLHPRGYTLIIRDITESRKTLDSLLRAATSDQLTGVANRRALFDAAELELARYVRKPRDISLLILDIDRFKRVNDTFGHPVGDRVIRSLADVLVRSVRSIDVVARLGGEEFAVLLPSTDSAMAAEIGERIRRNVATERIHTDSQTITYTVSIGVAMVEPGMAGLDELIMAADEALYEAKRSGRDRVCVKAPARGAE